MTCDDLILLKEKVDQALDELYRKDSYLIVNRPEGNRQDCHVSERGIVFRFGIYLQQFLYDTAFATYNIDMEYNRNLYQKKLLPSFENGTFPDLILHRRGRNDGNILIVEFKTWWNSNATSDVEKIKQFIETNGVYRYHLGASIVLGKEYPCVSWIE